MERTLPLPEPPESGIGDQLVMGPGRCKACDCRGFKPTGKKNDICADCGHYWQIHASA